MQGGTFQQAFVSAALGSLAASGFGKIAGDWAGKAGGQIFFGAISGGVGAELTGGNFWQGALIGGVVAGLNHAMHSIKAESPKDIIILNASKEVGGLGHDGTIIGNDKDGYYYIASNGLVDPYPKSELISGGKNEADVKYFKTKQEALTYAQSKYDYDRTFTIKTSRAQDFGAVAGALKQVRMDYFPLHNNCNHVVAGALNGAGLGGYAGYSTIPNINFWEIKNNFLKK